MNLGPGLQRTKIVIILMIVVVFVLLLASRFSGGESPQAVATSGQSFFSIDDGKTWFTAPATNVPPFEHDGRQAYQVFVWTQDGKKTQFVSHLLRYTPAGRKQMLAQGNSAAPGGSPSLAEIKRPGDPDSAWVPLSDPRAEAITRPKSSGTDYPEPVLP